MYRILEKIRTFIVQFEERDEDASWYKDHAREITEFVQNVKDLDAGLRSGEKLPEAWTPKKWLSSRFDAHRMVDDD